VKLLYQVRNSLRTKRYSYRTERCYVRWITQYVHFHKTPDGFRHPSTLSGPEVEQFLSHLAVEQHVAASTQNQAFAAAPSLTGNAAVEPVGDSGFSGRSGEPSCRRPAAHARPVAVPVCGTPQWRKPARRRPADRRGERVNTVAECTVPEKILLAAYELEEGGQSPFSAESLVVGAWQKYPRTFGLKGYDEQYPDSNKVLASIMGEKGLARRGWLVKMGQKLYALTRDGRHVVRRLLQGGDPPAADRPVKLSRDQDKLLQGLFASTAYDKYREGRRQELTFADACRFWNVTENLNGDALDARLDHLRATLAESERQVGLGSANLGDGHSITADDLGTLCDIHAHLLHRFSRHLSLLRNRAGRS
jgi:hypothetical protein